MDSPRRFQLVTAITVLRGPLVLAFVALGLAATHGGPSWAFPLALAILITAALSDLADGWLARHWDVRSELGAHLDPLMDKVFYLAALPFLVYLAGRNGHGLHALLLLVFTIAFLLRDQWVSFLRAIGSSRGVSGGANWSGKLRTILAFPLVCAAYLREGGAVEWPPLPALYACEALALAVNLISIYVYTKRYRHALRDAAKAPSPEA